MIVLTKKRYIATLLGVLFLAAYSVLLLSGSRGIRSSLATLSPAEGSALSTLARWDTLLQSRKDQGLDAASQSSLARMQHSLAAYTGSASGGAPSGQQPPAAGQPVNVVLLGGPTLGDEELWTTLSSISASAPEAVVLLLATPSQLSALAPSVTAPGAQRAAAPVDSSQQTSWRAARTRPLPLWLRAYSWPALEASLPPAVLALPHSLRRYALYLEALEELASASASASTSDLVLFSNLDAPRRTAPAGVLLCTSPDLVFQSNPFPGLWQLLKPTAAAPAAAPVTVVVSGEANVLQLRQDDASRARVSFCYYDLGEAMAGEQQIYSSGATFSTLQGIRHYIKEGMLPAMAHCATPNFDQSMDQGVHNTIMHSYSSAQLEGWRAAAAAGGPFRQGGGKLPIIAQPAALLLAVEHFQARLRVVVASAEEGLVCTMPLLGSSGASRGASGAVLPGVGKGLCAIVQQMDRSLAEHFRGLYS